ncbi:MAG: pirin family protein [Pseudomonadota bacterium]
MFEIRHADERGQFNYGWLETAHTFSFGPYTDLDHMNFRALRVINENKLQPGQGFLDYPHRNVEVLSYVLAGELSHRDSVGNQATLEAGSMQCLSAGSGVVHSEYNSSTNSKLHFLQIWLRPSTLDTPPRYQQHCFSAQDKQGRLCLLASGDGAQGSLQVQQDVKLYATLLRPGQTVEVNGAPERYLWLQVVRGGVEVNGQPLSRGDGGGLNGYHRIEIQGTEDSELLIFDLA